MDRMRDRLNKIARRSMSAPAGSLDPRGSIGTSEPTQPASRRPAAGRPTSATPARQTPPRQPKAPAPCAASAPARPTTARLSHPPVTHARVETPTPLAPARQTAGRGGAAPASRQPASPPPATQSTRSAHSTTARTSAAEAAARPLTARVSAGAPSGNSPRTTSAPSRPPAKLSQPPHANSDADVRAVSKPASHADALDTLNSFDTDRILELPARVSAARKQRRLIARADATVDATSDTAPARSLEPVEPPRAPATPTRKRTAHSDGAATTPSPRAAKPAAIEKRAAGATDDDNPLPDNIEPVGGAMQRFLTVLAERRRQRATGGGDGNGGQPPRSPEPEAVCPICGGAGYVRMDVPVGDPRFGQPVPCKCKEREFEERRRLEEERRVLELDRFFSLKPFGDKTFETFNPRVAGVKEAYEAARTFAEDPSGAPFRWLVLMGGTGVGKTHLAAAIAHERLEARSSVFFAVVPDLLDHLRAAFAPSAEMPYNEMFETVREVEMLILDDLGSENSTAWATEKLFQIINYRYNYRMPTVITTNARLFEHMDERIASRLADSSLARTVVIEAPSRRPRPTRQQASPSRQTPPRW